jgi:hypothetical protein
MISDKDIVWIIFAILIVLIIVAVYGQVNTNVCITFTAIGSIIFGILFVWFVLPLLIK